MGTLPDQLAHLRAQRDLTLAQLSQRSGVSLKTINDIELGRIAKPQLRTLYRLARGLEVDVSELVEVAS